MDRRSFLRYVGLSAAAAMAGCGRGKSQAAGVGDGRAQAKDEQAPQQEAAFAGTTGSRVVLVRSERWKKEVDVDSLRVGLAKGIVALTGAANAAEGWRRLIRPDENVAIKVNCLAGPGLCSSPQLTTAVVEELSAAGHPRGKIWVYERSSAELEECGYELRAEEDEVKCLGSDEVGYDEQVTVTGEVGTWFSLIVSQWADAIINVPVAKDHDLAGISGALKNHFGSISNPNKLHLPDISRAIADVAAAEVIARKQKIVIYDALKVCYDGGPGFKPATTKAYGAVILTMDPVAADAVVMQIIERMRREEGLPSLFEREAKPDHVKIAADSEHGLGCAEREKIELVEVEV